jgi:hypothetical protein
MEPQVEIILRMMGEEISYYEKLVEELKKEADFLKRPSPEDLLACVKEIARHTEAIERIHQSVRKKIEEILKSAGPERTERTMTGLMAFLPTEDSRKMQKYLSTLAKFKKWVMEINARNKAHIQNSLTYWQDLFSLLTSSASAAPVYVQGGKKRPIAQQPLTLDRKV